MHLEHETSRLMKKGYSMWKQSVVLIVLKLEEEAVFQSRVMWTQQLQVQSL